MARKKSTAPAKKNEKKSNHIESQIWGIVYMAFSFLVLVSLVSNAVGSGGSNILGKYVGSFLSMGLVHFFGPLPVFLLPFLLAYVGWKIFNSGKIAIKNLILISFFILQSCILAYIPHIEIIANRDQFKCKSESCNTIFRLEDAISVPLSEVEEIDVLECPGCKSTDYKKYYGLKEHGIQDNALGFNSVKILLVPIFGSNSFGPYFILIVTMLLTLIGFFQLDVKKYVFSLWDVLQKWLKKTAEEQKAKLQQSKNKKRDKKDLKRKKKREVSTTEAIEIVNYATESEQTLEEQPLDDSLLDEDLSGLMQLDDNCDSPFNSLEKDDLLDEEDGFVTPPINTYEGDDDMPEEESTDEILDDEAGAIDGASISDPSLLSGDGSDDHRPDEDELPPQKPYQLPSFDVIPDPPEKENEIDKIWIEEKSRQLLKTLEEFRVKGCKVVGVSPGPVVTQFEIELAPGIPVRKIINLSDDLALKVGGKSIRIQAPIPGKAYVGIEIPNDEREIVYFKEILNSKAFKNSSSALPVIIGKSIAGQPLVEDISKMPHLLIAGQTGAGKSVGINSFIASLLLSKKPDELRMILIDPKKVEMSCYEGIPHLMSPVVTEPEKAVAALQWGVREMEYRYRLLSKVGSKNLISYNKKFEKGALDPYLENETISESDYKKLPYIVIVVDELADLMMTASKDVEKLIQRIAQLARAVGIHLIVATQRPSVDIITGPIKANLTSRISFRTIQSQDSRTILGSIGAEKLLGRGDMLYLKNGAPAIERYHGAFISEEDVENLVDEIKKQGVETGKVEFREPEESSDPIGDSSGGDDAERDEFFEDATRIVVTTGLGSTSMIQRRLSVGYARAGRIMDQLEKAGVVGPPQGSKPRAVLITEEILQDMF